MVRKLNSSLFDWSLWRAGGAADFGLPTREYHLIMNKELLKEHTIGYCDGESLPCRPKENHKAVMFFKDEKHFWFHLTNKEFDAIYET